MPPATPINFVPWVFICFLFNYVIRRRHFGWWAKYNCASAIFKFDSLSNPWIPDALGMIDVLSAALDASYAVGTVVIFFALQYPDNGKTGLDSMIKKWWGNTLHTNTADATGVPNKVLGDGQTFGPTNW